MSKTINHRIKKRPDYAAIAAVLIGAFFIFGMIGAVISVFTGTSLYRMQHPELLNIVTQNGFWVGAIMGCGCIIYLMNDDPPTHEVVIHEH